MKKLFFIVFFSLQFLSINNFYGQVNKNSRLEESPNLKIGVNSLNDSLRIIRQELNITKSLAYSGVKKNEDVYSWISTQMSTVGIVLAVYSVLLAIAGVGFGIYLNRLSNKFEHIEEKTNGLQRNTKKLYDKIKKSEKNVKKLHNDLTSSLDDVHEKIRRKEIDLILNRLVKVPEDIGNFAQTLFTRELNSEDIDKIIGIFISLEEYQMDSAKSYLTVLFQHAPIYAYSHPNQKLRDMFCDKMTIIPRGAFKSEILFVIDEIFKLYNPENKDHWIRFVRNLLWGIASSTQTDATKDSVKILLNKLKDKQIDLLEEIVFLFEPKRLHSSLDYIVEILKEEGNSFLSDEKIKMLDQFVISYKEKSQDMPWDFS